MHSRSTWTGAIAGAERPRRCAPHWAAPRPAFPSVCATGDVEAGAVDAAIGDERLVSPGAMALGRALMFRRLMSVVAWTALPFTSSTRRGAHQEKIKLENSVMERVGMLVVSHEKLMLISSCCR